jgi:hypothetical protein
MQVPGQILTFADADAYMVRLQKSYAQVLNGHRLSWNKVVAFENGKMMHDVEIVAMRFRRPPVRIHAVRNKSFEVALRSALRYTDLLLRKMRNAGQILNSYL